MHAWHMLRIKDSNFFTNFRFQPKQKIVYNFETIDFSANAYWDFFSRPMASTIYPFFYPVHWKENESHIFQKRNKIVAFVIL